MPVVYFLYAFLKGHNKDFYSKILLVLSSLFFYAWWNFLYLPILILSIAFNFYIGSLIFRWFKEKKNSVVILALGIIINLLILGYFKYSNFLVENLNLIPGFDIAIIEVVLPLGISFFTFQQITYLVDCFRGDTDNYEILDYALFVSFFPQLIAGPIVHHKEMMPQFLKNKTLDIDRNIVLGIFIFTMGLFKKVLIADTFSTWATSGFDIAERLTLFDAWFTSLSYTFQLYFDFSGYSDMAIGLALLFNIRLPINFNSPYKSLNIQDFWNRWHITLSRFIREYLWDPISLQMTRYAFNSHCGSSMNFFYTIFVPITFSFFWIGLWHGAGWNFIIFGLFHGFGIIVFNLWKRVGIKLYRPISWFITFMYVNIGWIFFRAESFSDATKVLSGMFGYNGIQLPSIFEGRFEFLSSLPVSYGWFLSNINGTLLTPLFITLGFFIVLFFKNSNEQIENLEINYKTAFIASFLFSASVFSLTKPAEFLYFNF